MIKLCIFFFPLLVWAGIVMASPPTQAPSENSGLVRSSGLKVHSGTQPGEIIVSWWGYADHVYFIEHSGDLKTWTYVPTYEMGADAAVTMGFSLAPARWFWRLQYSDDPESDLLSTDYNGIGLSAWDQIQLGYNPFDWVDVDENGIHDAWELYHFGTISLDPNADTSGDGQTNETAFLSGSDPLAQSNPLVQLRIHAPIR